jgi:hypothetical protein
MQFEMFDRDTADTVGEDLAPTVSVSARDGHLLFNRPAARFLGEQYGAGRSPQVALLFSVETRTAGVRPLAEQEHAVIPVGARWLLVAKRSTEWPVGVHAPEFVEHYQLGEGWAVAVLVRGPGPRNADLPAAAGGALLRMGG